MFNAYTTTLYLNNTRYATYTRRKQVCGELDATKEVRQNGYSKTEATKGCIDSNVISC